MKRLSLLLMAICLGACDTLAPTPVTPNPTSVPLPPTAPEAVSTATPEPGFTLIPNTPIVVVPTDTPTPCVNDATFTADVTVPDNSQILPGAAIDKRWKIQNTGTCNWDSRYSLAFFEGSQMNAAGEAAIYPAKAGTPAILQVNMTAPDVPGDYTGRWQIRDPDGKPFGPVLFIKIVVVPPASPTPSS